MCPAKTQISFKASSQSDQSSQSAWRNLGYPASHWVHSEDSDQTGQMPSLIQVFNGCIGHFVGFVMLWLNFLVNVNEHTIWYLENHCLCSWNEILILSVKPFCKPMSFYDILLIFGICHETGHENVAHYPVSTPKKEDKLNTTERTFKQALSFSG